MPNIFISVQNKRAVLTTPIVIVNGNSDYLVTFTFDAEWDDYDAKTLEVKYLDRNCVKRKKEVLFEGSTVSLPILRDVSEVAIGVYAGNLHTTTCALIKCEKCISDDDGVHDPPLPDVYDQLLEYLAGMQGGGDRVSADAAMSGTQVTAGSAVIAQRQHQDVSLMAFSWEQGTGNPSTGALDSSDNYRIRCPEYIEIPQDYSGSMTVNAAVEGASTVYWTPYFYNSGKSFYGGQQWFECGAAVEIPPAYAAYTRIILCVSPSRATTITPEQLQACTAVFY